MHKRPEVDALGREKGWDDVVCRFCGSAGPWRWGWRYNLGGPKQRWRCTTCGRTFVEDDGFLRKRVDPDAICAAWDLFFRGTSGEGIARHLRVAWSIRASGRTVLDWVRGYSRLLADCLAAGMDDYVSKPVNLANLRAALQQVLPAAATVPATR